MSRLMCSFAFISLLGDDMILLARVASFKPGITDFLHTWDSRTTLLSPPLMSEHVIGQFPNYTSSRYRLMFAFI